MLYKGMTVLENIILGTERSHIGFLNKKRDYKDIEEISNKYHFQLPLKEKIDELPLLCCSRLKL